MARDPLVVAASLLTATHRASDMYVGLAERHARIGTKLSQRWLMSGTHFSIGAGKTNQRRHGAGRNARQRETLVAIVDMTSVPVTF